MHKARAKSAGNYMEGPNFFALPCVFATPTTIRFEQELLWDKRGPALASSRILFFLQLLYPFYKQYTLYILFFGVHSYSSKAHLGRNDCISILYHLDFSDTINPQQQQQKNILRTFLCLSALQNKNKIFC